MPIHRLAIPGTLPTGAAVMAHGDAITAREIESFRNLDGSLELAAALAGTSTVTAIKAKAPQAEYQRCRQAPDERCAEKPVLPFWLRLLAVTLQQVLQHDSHTRPGLTAALRA